VAERYARAPSYSEYLAASAAASSRAAEAAAFAARQAQEAAEAFAALAASEPLVEPESDWHPEKGAAARPEVRPATVEHPEPLPPRGEVPPRPGGVDWSASGRQGQGAVDAFAEAMVPAAVGLPAKLIEFPRELIATQKSRPRIAEGPLAEDAVIMVSSGEAPSLRIFEVEGFPMEGDPQSGPSELAGPQLRNLDGPGDRNRGHSQDEIAAGFATGAYARSAYEGGGGDDSGPGAGQGPGLRGAERDREQWQPIRLGEHPRSESAADEVPGQRESQAHAAPLHAAPLGDRLMAALVDAAIAGGAFLLFVVVFCACTAHPPLDKLGLGCGALVLVGLVLFYQWLFMSYGGGTPGMRYARIALCTFDDENPTKKVRRGRVWASVLSALPLGLGFLWALFDEDSLGWHDRMTRSYQRSYR
jgi:uncharacterized RDD family membrane protein YckC